MRGEIQFDNRIIWLAMLLGAVPCLYSRPDSMITFVGAWLGASLFALLCLAVLLAPVAWFLALRGEGRTSRQAAAALLWRVGLGSVAAAAIFAVIAPAQYLLGYVAERGPIWLAVVIAVGSITLLAFDIRGAVRRRRYRAGLSVLDVGKSRSLVKK